MMVPSEWRCRATASDADILNGQDNALTFSLVGAPAGAAIDPDTDVFTWTPAESAVPKIYTISVRVAEDGVPSKFDSQQSDHGEDAFVQAGTLVIGCTRSATRSA